MAEPPIDHNGVQLRDPADFDTLRKNIFDGVKEEVAASFPKSYGGVRLEVADLDYEGPEHNDFAAQKKGLLNDDFFTRKLRATVRLFDEKTGQLIEERRQSLMRVPWLTERGTFIHKGNEYSTINQGRLVPGPFTRRMENGLLETHFNPRPGSGRGFRLAFDPESAQYRLGIQTSQLHLYSLLKDLGHSDDDLADRWGSDVLRANAENYDARVLPRAYKHLVPTWRQEKEPSRDVMAEAVREALNRTEVNKSVAQRTLPNWFDPGRSKLNMAKAAGAVAGRMLFEKAADSLPFIPDLRPSELLRARLGDHIEARAEYRLLATKKATIAVDLDGTLAHKDPGEFDPEMVGKPIPAMVERVRGWLDAGEKVVIFTARAEDKANIPPIRAWLKELGDEFADLEITNRKTSDISEIWDDRAVGVERNKGVKAAADTCPGCGCKFAEDEPYPDVDMCEVCERYGPPKDDDGLQKEARSSSERLDRLRARRGEFYHGSPLGGLTQIDPKSSRVIDGEEAVFLSHDPDYALTFAAPWRDDDLEHGHVDGQFYMREKRPNAFEEIFDRPGSVYQLGPKEDQIEHDPRLTRTERIVRSAVPVALEKAYLNIWEELQRRPNLLLLRHGEVAPWEQEYAIQKSKDKQADIPANLVTWIPRAALDSVRKHGLLGANALLENPEALALAAQARGKTADEFAAEIRQLNKARFWRASQYGPNAFFKEPPAGWEAPENHPSKKMDLTRVQILLDDLLQDQPDTVLHGQELLPFDEAAWDQHGEDYAETRHHDLSPEELRDLRTRSAEELWRHFNDIEGDGKYAPNVPHAVIRTLNGRIDPKYLVFDDAPVKQASEALPVELGERKSTYWICPHCKEEIHEKHSYPKDPEWWKTGGPLIEVHRGCGGEFLPPPPSKESMAWLDTLKSSRSLPPVALAWEADSGIEKGAKINLTKLQAARKATEEPKSYEQATAGNYSKGTLWWNGLRIKLENSKGSIRRGLSPNGEVKWVSKMKNDYGYISGTRGADGDEMDVFVGPHYNSEIVFIVDQIDQKSGEFDEHKVILGCHMKDDAKDLYLSNYEAGWKVGAIRSMTFPQFKKWLRKGKKARPVADEQTVKMASSEVEGFDPDLDADAMQEAYDAIYGGIKPRLASMSAWPDEWMPPGSDSLGWINWYQNYLAGTRSEDDARQIKRWKAFKARHGAQFQKNPTPRRAFALRYWAIDPLKLLPEEQQADFKKRMDDYRANETTRWLRSKTASLTEPDLKALASFLNTHHNAAIPVEGTAEQIEEAIAVFLGADDSETSAWINASEVKIAAPTKGCLLTRLSVTDAVQVVQWTQENIPESSLAGQGVEHEVHVTVLYGFDPDVEFKELEELIDKPVHFRLGKVKRFPANEHRPESDVLVVGVDSDDLVRLNAKLKETFAGRVSNNYKDYTPHMTLAYVKPGACKKLDGHDHFDGQIFSCNSFIFSSPGGKRKKTIKV